MFDMKNVTDLRQSWDKRRPVIKWLLVFLGVMLLGLFGSSVALAAIGKFGFNISTFFIVFVVCNFIALLGIIGSWIFGATWENKDFLNILPQIIPNMNNEKEDKDEPPKEE